MYCRRRLDLGLWRVDGEVVSRRLELAAATHVRVADTTAFFALPEGQRGIFVGGGGSVRAARLMGVARMTDLMLTGRAVDALVPGLPGKVVFHGEVWNATSDEPVEKGGTVEVLAVEGRLARVRGIHPEGV